MLSERVADGGERKASRAISETPIGGEDNRPWELGQEVGWRWCPDLISDVDGGGCIISVSNIL